MNKIWQMWEGELSEGVINRITTECELYQPMTANVGLGDDGKVKEQVRSSTVRWIDPNDTDSAFITNLLWKYVAFANRNAFGVDVTNIFDIQYTIYEAKDSGHYDWHYDTFWGNDTNMDRKLSITVQLSDPTDYEGGDFLIDPQYQNPDPDALKTKGTILVFPSVIRHQVTTVTKGTRKSLVAWVEGPKWR